MRPLEFRDPSVGRSLCARIERALARTERPAVTLMHVCGSHEQALARFGLRAMLPARLRVLMGPGCPVCVTDTSDVDAAVALARSGVAVLTYGDMLRVPGAQASLDDARAEGHPLRVVYSALDAVAFARARAPAPVVFFATGFETTAVATAAVLLAGAPENFFVLSAHKWVPAAMDAVAQTPATRVEGYLAAGHAATVTGFQRFEPFVQRFAKPVVVAGFEPLDVLAGLAVLTELVVDGRAEVHNAFPRCVRPEGNRRALELLFRVFETTDGDWRGVATVPGGELRLREEFARHDARRRFADVLAASAGQPLGAEAAQCLCGKIMAGLATPKDCALFGTRCRPGAPVGACMVSTEGPCRIWLEHGVAAS